MERKMNLAVTRDFSKIQTPTMRKLCHQIESRGRDVGFNNISNIVPVPNDSFALLTAQADEKKIIVANNSSDTGEHTLSNNRVDISKKEEEEEASLDVEQTLQQQIPRRSCMNTHGCQKTETLTWI